MKVLRKISSQRKTYKLNIDGECYHFRLTFNCWLKLEERYGTNAACIVDNFILGVDRIMNIMRILSCACVEEIEVEELADRISFTPQNLEVLGEMTLVITGLNKSDEVEEVKKNEYTPPNPKDHIVDYDFYYTVAKAYLGYSYDEFWNEANPYEVIESWNKYVKLNGWDKNNDQEEGQEEKDYYTIDDL